MKVMFKTNYIKAVSEHFPFNDSLPFPTEAAVIFYKYLWNCDIC